MPGSPFDASIILKSIRLVLDGALSLRGASRACNIIDQCDGGLGLDAPSQTTIQNHINRIGLYLIEQTDRARSDQVWLLDHTIGAGTTKCLIVMEISLQDYRKSAGRLTHQDFNVIGLMPVDQSNGELVHQQLCTLSDQFGVPVATLSDRGSDLKKGVELFQQQHREVTSLYDIVHLVSRVIKAIFEANPNWAAYRIEANKCANGLRQSALAHLKPPTPKTKARYMNFDREVRWISRALGVLDRVRQGNLEPHQRARLPKEAIEKRLSWLERYRVDASIWMEVIWTGKAINELVRRIGYRTTTAARIRDLAAGSDHDATRQLIERVAAEVETMCSGFGADEFYPGSTEVLESLIGKAKRLLGFNASNGLTRYLLSVASATAELSTGLIQRALSKCRTKHVQQWAKDNFSIAVHTKRQEDLVASPEEVDLRNLINAAMPNF